MPLTKTRQRAEISKCHKKSALILLVIGAICILVSTSFSLNHLSENAATSVSTNGLKITVTPANISLPEFLSSFAQVEITTQSNIPFSNLSVYVVESGKVVQKDYFSYKPTTFAVSYVHIPDTLSGGNGTLQIYAEGAGSTQVSITWNGNLEGVELALALYSGIAAICLGLALFGSGRIKAWYLLPLFLAMSVIFGQRYDDFFLISPGFRLIAGVDPYKPSTSLLPGLQWAYPPFYLMWSYLLDKVYLILPLSAPVANSSLNYLGTEFGNPYGAWKALAGSNLLVLYGLAKLPLVLSFLWVFKTLKDLTGREHWKLWLLNPFVLIVAVMWGQLDVLAVAFMLQAILLDKSGKTWMAVLAASIGGAIKVFPLLLVPYILLRSRSKLLDLTATLPVLGATLAIYQLTGGILGSVRALLFARAIPTFGGVFVSNGFSWQVLLSYFGVSTFPSLFLWVFVPGFIIFTAISLWRGISLTSYSAMVILIFFLTYNFVNPQYLIWLIPLLVLVNRETYALLLSALGSIFMLFTYSYTYFLNPIISWNYQSSPLGQIENIKVFLLGSAQMRAALAIMATSLFIYMLLEISRKSFAVKAAASSD